MTTYLLLHLLLLLLLGCYWHVIGIVSLIVSVMILIVSTCPFDVRRSEPAFRIMPSLRYLRDRFLPPVGLHHDDRQSYQGIRGTLVLD